MRTGSESGFLRWGWGMAYNPEKGRAKIKKWAQANPEKERARKNAWAQANAEKVRARKNAWAQANREIISARNRANRIAKALGRKPTDNRPVKLRDRRKEAIRLEAVERLKKRFRRKPADPFQELGQALRAL
jgi:hypothetical protein